MSTSKVDEMHIEIDSFHSFYNHNLINIGYATYQVCLKSYLNVQYRHLNTI